MIQICIKCNIEKPFTEFYKAKRNKSGVQGICKKCFLLTNQKNRLENQENYVEIAYKYANSEHGFLSNRISCIFSKKNIERAGIPTANKKEIQKSFYEYVEKHGRNCFYCKEPWTYIAKKVEPGVGRYKLKMTKRINIKNLSFDRLDNDKPYSVDNIIFCCKDCNLRKNQISIKMIKLLYEIITERNL
jgi:hypothetical protein